MHRHVRAMVFVLVVLVAGCARSVSPTAPTSAPSAPTVMPLLPTVTPMPPTATLVPPTTTPLPPTATLVPPTTTPLPPTATATPSVTALGEEAESGPWRMSVISVKQVDSINALGMGTYMPVQGRALYVAELEIENIADGPSALVFDPQAVYVVDSDGDRHMSIGGAIAGGAFFSLHIYHAGGSSSTTIEPTAGEPEVTFTAKATDIKTKEWSIELSGKGATKLTMAFNVPKDAHIEELLWPQLLPFSLE